MGSVLINYGLGKEVVEVMIGLMLSHLVSTNMEISEKMSDTCQVISKVHSLCMDEESMVENLWAA